ncbi:MAG: GxxExxY protein [Bacteroidetes bacterium]|nr:GxxExxY protein [Bacteroidota bacterium]
MDKNDKYLHSALTGTIIKAYYNVYNSLGYGFLEKVYENALMIELKKFDLKCDKQVSVTVFYDSEKVGEYYADIVVNDSVIIELKACEYLLEEHEAQLLNYLRATNIEVGLLLNFGKEAEFKRKAFSNIYKNHNKQTFHPTLS